VSRKTQYLATVGALVGAFALGLLGFTLTGGAIPWGERFAAVATGTVESSGELFQVGRGGFGGFLLAGPLRDDVVVFLAIVAALVVGSAALYWYSTRDNGETPDGPSPE